MKKLSIMASLLMGLAVLTSCETDHNDNPTLQQPSSFTMNAPALGNAVIDLKNTSAVELVAQQQPDYGFPTYVTYGAQMSLNQNWNDSASVYNIDASSSSTKLTISGAEIDRGIMTLAGYENETQVDKFKAMSIFVRMTAKPLNMDATNTIYSNVFEMKAYPYYLELSNEPIHLWWLIGDCIGNGAWKKDGSADSYLSVFPLTPEKDFEFSKKTGNGEFQTTIYVPADQGFKIVADISSDWTEQWGEKDGAFVKNDGGSSDIKREAGFYTITLNTIDDKLTVEKTDISPDAYTAVSIIGAFNDWADATEIDMAPANGAGENNHMWTATVTFSEDTQFKFRANHAWSVNWGFGAEDGEINDCGFGEGNGKNIGIEAGTYTMYLNDIDGYFRIIKHEK